MTDKPKPVKRPNYAVARAVRLEMLRAALTTGRSGPMDEELVGTDRMLGRWAVSIGEGLPTERWDDSRQSHLPELDDDTAILVDKEVLRSPARAQFLVRKWYKSPAPSDELARTMGLSRAGLYIEWRAVLGYFRERFLELKLPV